VSEAENLINTLRQTSVPISSKLVGRVVDEMGRLQARVEGVEKALSCKVVELRGCYELCTRKDEKASRESSVLQQIREVCALPDAPLEELPALIENLLSELADRQIRSDIEAQHDAKAYELAELASLAHVSRFAWPSAVLDDLCANLQARVAAYPAGDPEDDEW